MKTELVIILICVIGLMLTAPGCVMREYQHDIDPNRAETHFYKEIYFMADASAERVKITKQDGTIVEINTPVQTSQDIKLINPAVGIVETH